VRLHPLTQLAPGTVAPQRITLQSTYAGKVAKLVIQANPANQGPIILGQENMNVGTGSGVYLRLLPGQVEVIADDRDGNTTLPADYWVIAENEADSINGGAFEK
jgi:hypothetical protein